MKNLLILPICLGLLVGCGSESDESTLGSALSGQAKAIVDARRNPQKEAEPLTREKLSHIKRKVLLMTIASRGVKQSLATKVGENRGFETFQNKNGQAITLSRGKLAATRGFGEDLLVADLSSNSVREYKYLDPENHQTRLVLNCEITSKTNEQITIVERTYKVIKTEEVCKNSWKAVKNRYWRDARTGKLWKAQQWAGLKLGFVVIEVLN